MSKRGSAILSAYQAQLEAERLAQHVTQRCCWCPKWIVTGTLAETRELHRAHRAKHHPEARERKHKQRPGSINISGKTVGDNIQKVRAQGGATWDGAA